MRTELQNISPALIMRAAVKKGELTILDLLDSLPWFRGAASWTAWRAFLAAVYGLPMTQLEYAIFVKCTGRKEPPKRKVREAWVPVGRRGRKSAIMATLGVFEGGFRDHSGYLAPGERARIPVIAKDKDDAGAIHGFATAILSEPALKGMLESEPTAENIALENRCDIRTKPARITAGRSRAVVLALYDEIAFWPKDESATPDEEIIRGVEPGMANVPGALTVGMSSPYARKGVLYKKFKEWYGIDSDEVLVWEADTLTMHNTPSIQEYVQKAWRDDPTSAKAEVGSDGHVAFREDVESYVSEEIVERAIVTGLRELRPTPGVQYSAFVDPAGGTADSFTLGISHYDHRSRKAVLDAVREWPPPFEPDVVVAEATQLLRDYSIQTVTGDHWGGEWPRVMFTRGIHGQKCPKSYVPGAECSRIKGVCWTVGYVFSEDTKSDIYRDFLPALNSGEVQLLDIERLKNQLVGLDRKTSRGGRDSIDHGPNGHDDVANAACGAILKAYRARKKDAAIPKPPPATLEELRAEELAAAIRRVTHPTDQEDMPERYKDL